MTIKAYLLKCGSNEGKFKHSDSFEMTVDEVQIKNTVRFKCSFQKADVCSKSAADLLTIQLAYWLRKKE
jgi:hypothetical protein